MREIKFRAWHPDFKKYYYFDFYTLYCINPFKVNTSESSDSNSNVLFNINHGPFEQFIGLYDKNGKEIYEGDIIKTKYDGIDVVEFDDSMGFYPFTTPAYGGSEWESCLRGKNNEYIEIIGNIHENTELINE